MPSPSTTLRAALAACALATLPLLALGAPDQASAPLAASTPAAVGTTAMPRQIEYHWMSVARWHEMAEAQQARAAEGNLDLLVVGDSNTEGWKEPHWSATFGQYHPGNFGIGGDHTGNLLWRMQQLGTVRTLHPTAVVLLIGVNNLNLIPETPAQTAAGIAAVVASLRTSFPDAKILLNAVFPEGQLAGDPKRAAVIELNRLAAALGDERHVFFRDYGARFLSPNGDIAPEIMADFLHLTPAGYQIWSDAMAPDLRALMRKDG